MTLKNSSSLLSIKLTMLFLTFSAHAEEQQQKKPQVETERIQITGSYIRRSENFNSPSPLMLINNNEIEAIGAKSIADITQTLTINSGAQNNPDAFTQLTTVGTSNINLRGLGVSSTLVLLNGKRQVVSAQQTNDGSSFVDTSSLVPMIALDKIEIVKDGASALYGSDAVAGVVNFQTKSHYDGIQLSADYQDGAYGSHREFGLQGLWGKTNNTSSIMAAISYGQRSPLYVADHRLSRIQDDTSSLGNPGSYFVHFAGLGTLPIIDPYGCEQYGGIESLRAPAGTAGNYQVGFCQFDFGPYFTYVADESKLNSYLKTEHQLTSKLNFINELSLAFNSADRRGAPSNPILTSPIVPASHPQNPFAQDVAFFGRTLGQGAATNQAATESDTFRFSTLLQGETADLFWELSYTHALNNFIFTTTDVLDKEFKLALNGLAGSGCDPVNDRPGLGNCEYFNPFSSSYSTAPNSQTVLDFITGDEIIDSKSELQVIDAYSSFELFELDSKTAEIALGLQYRKERLRQDYNELANQDSFTFLIGNPDFSGDIDLWAAFAELGMPVTDNSNLQLAVRFEDYGGQTGSTIDPKLAFSWQPRQDLTLRASASTSFHAPTVFLLSGGSTTLQQVSDPIQKTNAFAAVRTKGNQQLKPEESTAYNFGMSFEPIADWSIDLDYWSFKYSDLIIRQNAQALLSAFPQDPNLIIRANDPLSGPVLQINNTFENATELSTSGLDLSSRYHITSKAGIFSPSFIATYVRHYDLNDPQAGRVDGVGQRNFTNIGVSSPELRFSLGLNWQHSAYSANVFLRFISSYEDDQNCKEGTLNLGNCLNGFKKIESHSTADAQFKVDLSQVFTTNNRYEFTLGGINLTNEDPPQVFTNSGYDSKVHDPRGRQLYARIGISF